MAFGTGFRKSRTVNLTTLMAPTNCGMMVRRVRRAPLSVRVKCALPLQYPVKVGILRGAFLTGLLISLDFDLAIVADGCVSVGYFNMGFEADVTLTDRQAFKPVCEQCGSLTVALPIEAQPDPCLILKCGRCGFPRGTLQSLRNTSIQPGIQHVV